MHQNRNLREARLGRAMGRQVAVAPVTGRAAQRAQLSPPVAASGLDMAVAACSHHQRRLSGQGASCSGASHGLRGSGSAAHAHVFGTALPVLGLAPHRGGAGVGRSRMTAVAVLAKVRATSPFWGGSTPPQTAACNLPHQGEPPAMGREGRRWG